MSRRPEQDGDTGSLILIVAAIIIFAIAVVLTV